MLFLLILLLAPSHAAAQCSGPITVLSSSYASSISSCTTYNGDITISSNAVGAIFLDGIQTITGSLTVSSAPQVTAISSNSLISIAGSFALDNLKLLKTLQFDSLSRINNVSWTALPSLQGLNLNAGVSQANTIYIVNTALSSLNGLKLNQVGTININNNPSLGAINLNNLTNITNAGSFIASNSQRMGVSLTNLVQAGNLTFGNTQDGADLSSLVSVGNSLGFYGNNYNYMNASKLTTVGSNLAISDSPVLTALSFPALRTIGGDLVINANTAFARIDGFYQLQTIQGDVRIIGNFSSITLPVLNRVIGTATITTSSSNNTICNLFRNYKSSGVIQGSETCQALGSSNSATATSGGGLSSSSSSAPNGKDSGTSSSGLSTGAGIGLGVGIGILALVIVGMLVWYFYFHRRKQQRQDKQEKSIPEPKSGTHQMPLGGHHETAELLADPNYNVSELTGDQKMRKDIDIKTTMLGSGSITNTNSETRTDIHEKSEFGDIMTSRISGPAELHSHDFMMPELEGSAGHYGSDDQTHGWKR